MNTPITALEECLRELDRAHADGDQIQVQRSVYSAATFLRTHGKALSEALGGWLPISEAPKDGRSVMIFCKGAGVPAIASWDQEVGMWMSIAGESFSHPIHYRELPPPPTSANGAKS